MLIDCIRWNPAYTALGPNQAAYTTPACVTPVCAAVPAREGEVGGTVSCADGPERAEALHEPKTDGMNRSLFP